MEDKKLYPINYLGKTYNTTIHKDLSDEEFEQVRREYYTKPSFDLVKRQFISLENGGKKHNYITNYYVKDLIAKTKVHFNNWTIEEALNYKPLVEFFAGKADENKKVFPDSMTLGQKVETCFRLCGFKTASKPSNFPIDAIDVLLDDFNINGIYYDPSCGWGVRMLSSLRHHITYYGTDPNYMLTERLNNMADDYRKVTNNLTITDIRTQGSEEFISEWENKIGFVFTSPPYFNLEDYKIGKQSWSDGVSYEDWKNNYLKPTIQNIYRYLIDDGVFAININNFKKYNDYDLIGDTVKISEENGFHLIEVRELKNITRCHGHKEYKGVVNWYDNNEHIFIFNKSGEKQEKKPKVGESFELF